MRTPCVFSQHHDLAAVEAIVKDVFERFDEGKKGHLSKEDFAKWTADQPVVDEVGQPALHIARCVQHSTLCTLHTCVLRMFAARACAVRPPCIG